jgi:hypothetical protein
VSVSLFVTCPLTGKLQGRGAIEISLRFAIHRRMLMPVPPALFARLERQ